MDILIIILVLGILYVIIQLAIDRSINTAMLKEINKQLKEIKELLNEISNKND